MSLYQFLSLPSTSGHRSSSNRLFAPEVGVGVSASYSYSSSSLVVVVVSSSSTAGVPMVVSSCCSSSSSVVVAGVVPSPGVDLL
jgi:hypothetical protein